jgi:hypothetical protein
MRTELLRPIDGLHLAEEYRALLRPGEIETDANGTVHHLPRFFYEIASWEQAHEIRLAPHFTLAELMLVDSREARLLLSQFPHTCQIFRGFPARGRCTGVHQREWRVPFAGTSDWWREKHSCMGNGGEYLSRRRHFSFRRKVHWKVLCCCGIA